MEFSRQEYWSGLPVPSPGDLPDSGIESGLPDCRQILYQLSYQGRPHLRQWPLRPLSVVLSFWLSVGVTLLSWEYLPTHSSRAFCTQGQGLRYRKPIILQSISPRDCGCAEQPLTYVRFEGNWLNPKDRVQNNHDKLLREKELRVYRWVGEVQGEWVGVGIRS